MRARSGAYHADTEQSFLDLVVASEDSTGLFYDNRVNSKVMKKLKNKKEPITSPIPQIFESSSIQKQLQRGSFSGFDFSLQIQVDKQEREQLERMSSSPLKQINVGILTNRSNQVLQDLSEVLGVPTEDQQLQRGVNLVITTKGQTICKYWIFEKELLNKKDELITLYLDHCSQLYDIDQAYHYLNVLRQGKKGEQSGIKENISTILT